MCILLWSKCYSSTKVARRTLKTSHSSKPKSAVGVSIAIIALHSRYTLDRPSPYLKQIVSSLKSCAGGTSVSLEIQHWTGLGQSEVATRKDPVSWSKPKARAPRMVAISKTSWAGKTVGSPVLPFANIDAYCILIPSKLAANQMHIRMWCFPIVLPFPFVMLKPNKTGSQLTTSMKKERKRQGCRIGKRN